MDISKIAQALILSPNDAERKQNELYIQQVFIK